MAPTSEYLKASDFLEFLKEETALVNSDLNVPIAPNGKTIEDIFRITQAASFIRELLDAGVVPLIATHLGRPKGFDPKDSLDVLVEPLSEAIGKQVEIIRFDPATGSYDPSQLNRKYIMDLARHGAVSMLDNTRFDLDQIRNGQGLAERLSCATKVSIQNSFGTAHRTEATSNYIHEFVPGFAGGLLVQEIEGHRAIKKPSKSYVVIAGGDKPEDTFNLLRAILRATATTYPGNQSDPDLNLIMENNLVNHVLVGGHLMHAFAYAQLQMLSERDLAALPPGLRKDYRGLREAKFDGYNGYTPTPEEITLARGLLRLYNQRQFADDNGANEKRRLVIPIDYQVIRSGVLNDSIRLNELLDGDIIIDIGAKTREVYGQIIGSATTIVWNGPMGVDDISHVYGTRHIIDAIHNNKSAVKTVGGGSTMSMINAYEREIRKNDPNLGFNVGHRSTGGGATLLETHANSPVAKSLIMSHRKLLEGGYGPKFEYLRTPAIKMSMR